MHIRRDTLHALDTEESLTKAECKRLRAIGFNLAIGVAQAIALMFILATVLQLATNAIGLGTDDSDRSGFARSGVSIATDHKTGLQYLLGPNGGLTPRLDGNGRQLTETLPQTQTGQQR